jgi:hypothetical protein
MDWKTLSPVRSYEIFVYTKKATCARGFVMTRARRKGLAHAERKRRTTMSYAAIHPNWEKSPDNMVDGYSLEMTAKEIEGLKEAAPHDPPRHAGGRHLPAR